MAAATSAPIELKFGEESYFMSPLTIRDCEELDHWLHAKFINTARAAFTPEMSVADRKEILDSAMETAASLTFMSAAGMKQFATMQGIAKLFHVSVRTRSPDLTYQHACELMMSPEAMQVFQTAFDKLNLTSRQGGRPGNPPKTETKAERKRKKLERQRKR